LDSHRTGRFFRYAIGEILLVVVGILIALQINNWNEERIEQQQIREYALNLASDIQRDMVMIETIDFQIRRMMVQAEAFANYARGRPVEDFDNARVVLLTTFNDYRPFTWSRAAMEQLKTSGGLRQMRNQHLVSQISAYDALTHHLDQDYDKDVNLSNMVQDFVDQVRDSNYINRSALASWIVIMDEESSEIHLEDFENAELIASLQAEALPLLTDDVRDLRILANYQLQVQYLIAPRVDHELPTLRELADEILKLIAEEYPQS